jgi:DNA-binding NarL/FixJ family response regulator
MNRPESTHLGSDRARFRVLIVEDHPMAAKVIGVACEHRESLEVVGVAADGLRALELVADLHPDVVVLDLGLPVMDGFEVIRALREEGSTVRIIVLTGQVGGRAVFESIRLGADGFAEKTGSIDEIAAAIEAVAGGTRVFSIEHRRQAGAQLGELVRSSREAIRISAALTARERQVLALLADGLSSRQMASRLSISQRTVESHIGNLYQKMGVRTRMHAVREAARLKLLDLGASSDSQGRASPVR